MSTENFDSLEKILDNALEPYRDQDFDSKSAREFFQKVIPAMYHEMELEFAKLGFRDNKTDKTVEKILIFRADVVGDFILNSAAIRELRMNYPSANITLAVSKSAYPLAELCPYVNKVICMDISSDLYSQEIDENLKVNGVTIKNSTVAEIKDAFNLARKYFLSAYYDTCICFHTIVDDIKSFMTYFSGASKRVGYIRRVYRTYTDSLVSKENDISYLLLTQPLIYPKNMIHEVTKELYILESMGLKISNDDLEIWFDKQDLKKANDILKDFAPNKMKIVVAIGANHSARKYPVEKYLQAFKKITEKNSAIIIIGGPDDKDDAKFLQENLPADSVLNVAELRAGWRVDAAITSQCDMYIGSHTGSKDLASVFHLPVIAVSRISKDRVNTLKNVPSENEIYAPYKTKSIILQPEHQLCDYMQNDWSRLVCCTVFESHCIAQIEPEEIVTAFNKMLEIMNKK